MISVAWRGHRIRRLLQQSLMGDYLLHEATSLQCHEREYCRVRARKHVDKAEMPGFDGLLASS